LLPVVEDIGHRVILLCAKTRRMTNAMTARTTMAAIEVVRKHLEVAGDRQSEGRSWRERSATRE
jgi:hypothetical protein